MADVTQHSLDDRIQIGEAATNLGNRLLGVGAVALIGALALGGGPLTKGFQSSYLVAFLYVLSMGLGALWFVTVQHLTNAKWSVVVRRVAELLAANMALLGVLALVIVGPMLMGKSELYAWVDQARVQADHLLHHKAPYLNVGFFVVRCVVYFGFWAGLAGHFLKQSVAQDQHGKAEVNGRLQSLAAPGMIVLSLTLTFAAIDFIMSLDAEFFSTIFGVYYFAGCVLAGYSTLVLCLIWLQSHGCLARSVNREHFHDLGKFMFAFIVFWAYIAFSQFMLIWYGDIPEETAWYRERFGEAWLPVSILLLVAHFAVPFFGLMSRQIKRNRKTLGFWACWILGIHYVDLYWLVMPTLSPHHVPVSAVDVLCWVGLVALFAGAALRRMRGGNLVPIKDPRLGDSLAFQNI